MKQSEVDSELLKAVEGEIDYGRSLDYKNDTIALMVIEKLKALGYRKIDTGKLAVMFRENFMNYLTVDSDTQDARRKDFNQAIFDAKEGWAVFNDIDLDMVMEKLDKALAHTIREQEGSDTSDHQ